MKVERQTPEGENPVWAQGGPGKVGELATVYKLRVDDGPVWGRKGNRRARRGTKTLEAQDR